MTQLCPKCGAKVAGTTDFCEYCGATLPERPRRYPNHPQSMHPNYQQPRNQQPYYSQNRQAQPVKNRLLAALLAFFLGSFGVHKFYLGQTGAGIAMLLFCWTGIPAFISFIDFIVLLCQSDQAFMHKYNCGIEHL